MFHREIEDFKVRKVMRASLEFKDPQDHAVDREVKGRRVVSGPQGFQEILVSQDFRDLRESRAWMVTMGRLVNLDHQGRLDQ